MKRSPILIGALVVAGVVAVLGSGGFEGPSTPRAGGEPSGGADGRGRDFAESPHSRPDPDERSRSNAGSAVPSPRSGVDAVDPSRPARLARGEIAVSGAWGSAGGEFGRRRDPEANLEAPAALAAGPDGDHWILDQVNQRAQRFRAGKLIGSIAASETVQDIAALPDGRVLLLDRLVDRSVKLYDENGQLINETPIVGERLSEGGAATGVFADDSGVYVEREHGPLVRVADSKGNVDGEQREIPGRPTRDGRLVVVAAITDRVAGRIVVSAFNRSTFESAWSRELGFPRSILHVVLLDSDSRGNVYIAAATGREGTEPPFPILDEAIVVGRLAPDGSLTGWLEIPSPKTGDELGRPLAVGDDGSIDAMMPSEEGLSVVRYRFD